MKHAHIGLPICPGNHLARLGSRTLALLQSGISPQGIPALTIPTIGGTLHALVDLEFGMRQYPV